MGNTNKTAENFMADLLGDLDERLSAFRQGVEAYITPERVARYLTAIADTPAPSTTASAMRGPVMGELLRSDGVLTDGRLTLEANFRNTGSMVMLSGKPLEDKPLWYFAHLDTISYLLKAFDGERYPLQPFCYHLTESGSRAARCYRFDLRKNAYHVVADGWIESEGGIPFFRSSESSPPLDAGDRVVPVANCRQAAQGRWTGHFDNAGGVSALAVAAPVLANAGIDAMFAFPDEEEGPPGSGNQIMGRGGSRIIDKLAPPDLALVADMQQAIDPSKVAEGHAKATKLGHGAVLSEFSSLARGAVTPPPLFGLARHLATCLANYGVKIQEANSNYTSRSDDVSVMLKTPNILLLGFPGLDRHFDNAEPSANLDDIVDLSRALVYMAALQPVIRAMNLKLGGSL